MTDVYLKSVLKRLRTSAATADAVDGFQAFVTPEEARALLAHIRAQDAELARLRDALAALVDAEAHGTPGGYIGVDPSGETHDRHCTYCYTSWRMGEPERHDDDCPVAVARALLDGGA